MRKGQGVVAVDNSLTFRAIREEWLQEHHLEMQVATGTVVAGKLVIEGLDLPDGETVVVLARETEDEVHLSEGDEAELLEAIAEADRGEMITAEELFARLDRKR